MPTPNDVLAALLRSDPARPRVTCYDDIVGERVELSARVLANWVAKAANALTDGYAAGPGSSVRLAVPPLHWRTLYWALAAWAVGADVVPGGDADVLVSDTDAAADIVVTLPALARSHPGTVHPAAMDEARELASYGDRFEPSEPAGADWVGDRAWPAGTRLALTGEPTLVEALTATLAAFAVDGSVVLFRGTSAERVARLASTEGVTETVTA